jgi:3-deoxy-manno-octulosonate cytidylyltransferase (CMP-KDO synthetase)
MARQSRKAIAIIPARMGSTRFPGKAMASETGRPMVVHVCERAALAESVDRVVVATDSDEIAEAVADHGFEAVVTGEHPNGTSRLAEAGAVLDLDEADEIVNVQGDEPEIEPGLIDAALLALRTGASVGTVAAPFALGEDPGDPNIVKAVVGRLAKKKIAPGLYFTRGQAPYVRDASVEVVRLKHVGLYAYSFGSLLGYLDLEPTPLERAECLEQLRWLEHGLRIAVAVRESAPVGIDTPQEYAAFVQRWREQGGGGSPPA